MHRYRIVTPSRDIERIGEFALLAGKRMKSNLGVPWFHCSPAPPPPIAAVQKAAAAANSTAPLQIRAPSELLLGLPANLRTTQWRHPAQTLLKEHIKYEVQVGRSTPQNGGTTCKLYVYFYSNPCSTSAQRL